MSAIEQQGPPQLGRWQTSTLIAGLAGLVLCAAVWFVNPAQFFRSYLIAYIFWAGIALGCLAILMIQYLTGGAWGIIARRPLESATSTLPLLAVLFLPLFLGMHSLYGWTHPEAIASDPLLEHKRLYLNTAFFVARWVICFGLWTGTAYLLNRWSRAQDRTGDPRLALNLQSLSGPGLFVLAVSLTFALIDWVMSLDPDWYSTIYSVSFIAGETLAAFAFVISIVVLMSGYPPLSTVITEKHFRDFGNLLLTFVMLWAYCSFSQFLIIWSGNLREEIPWYLQRVQNGWGWIAAALIVFHFFVPFFLLLSIDVKRRPRVLGVVAVIILSMRFVDLFWLITPAFYARWDGALKHLAVTGLALIGLGGVWLSMVIWRLRTSPILPLHDPYMKEAFDDKDA